MQQDRPLYCLLPTYAVYHQLIRSRVCRGGLQRAGVGAKEVLADAAVPRLLAFLALTLHHTARFVQFDNRHVLTLQHIKHQRALLRHVQRENTVHRMPSPNPAACLTLSSFVTWLNSRSCSSTSTTSVCAKRAGKNEGSINSLPLEDVAHLGQELQHMLTPHAPSMPKQHASAARSPDRPPSPGC